MPSPLGQLHDTGPPVPSTRQTASTWAQYQSQEVGRPGNVCTYRMPCKRINVHSSDACAKGGRCARRRCSSHLASKLWHTACTLSTPHGAGMSVRLKRPNRYARLAKGITHEKVSKDNHDASSSGANSDGRGSIDLAALPVQWNAGRTCWHAADHENQNPNNPNIPCWSRQDTSVLLRVVFTLPRAFP